MAVGVDCMDDVDRMAKKDVEVHWDSIYVLYVGLVSQT